MIIDVHNHIVAGEQLQIFQSKAEKVFARFKA